MKASIRGAVDECAAKPFAALEAKPAGKAGDIIVPEETIFGIVSRYHALTGHPTSKDTLIELLNRRCVTLGTAFPSGLDLILQHLPLPVTKVEDLVENHTVLPYFRSFSNPTYYPRVACSISAGNARNTKITLGLLASRLGAENVLRFCPACAESDRGVIGVATWYRVHQLPGVLVCPYHRVPLVADRCLVQRLKRQQLFLPGTAAKWDRDSSTFTINERAYEKLLLIARLSAQLLLYRQTPVEATTWRNQYLIYFAEKGLATANFRIRHRQLRSEFLDFWSDLEHVAPFSRLLERCVKDDSWLANLYRRPRSSHHPLLHILLIGFLAESVDSFRSVRSKPLATTSYISPCMPVATENKIASLVAKGLSLRQVAKEIGLSINSVLVKAESMGVIVKRRPKKLGTYVRSQVRFSLASGEAISSIAHATNLSASTINRILGADRELQVQRHASVRERRKKRARESFSAAIANAPSAGFKELQATLPSDFAWLYRHDRTWFSEHLPVATRSHARESSVDWEARDRTMLKEIVVAAAEILSRVERPIRLSFNMISRHTNHATWLENLAKMPRARTLLAQLVEPVSTFQLRRLIWCEQQSDAEYMARWRIVRAAGLRCDPAIDHSQILKQP